MMHRETCPYHDFKFHCTFRMMVVGPTECGKTHFVKQLLTKPCIKYPTRKPKKIVWFHSHWQSGYQELKSCLGNVITFCEGIPQFSEDLREINPKYNNILVFDDLMREAVDSPVLSHLFSKGRHRNASTILLLQNMFPKGKYNTDIARNAQYTVMFRSPRDRKQIDIRTEKIFAKDRSKFMEVYHQVTAKPFGYFMVDSHPQTPSEKQVAADIFGDCRCYPSIIKH